MDTVIMDVPYRCPRCGGARTFNSLAELKSHMAEEHAYGAQRRRRLRIFDYTPQHPSDSGRHSPLLQSFLDEGQRLEDEVKIAKQEELNNKLHRQTKALSQSSPSLASSGTGRSVAKSGASPRKLKVNFSTPPKSQEPDPYIQESLSQLNHEMLVQRHQHWRTADALYSTQDVLSGVEEAAEDRVSEQKNFISDLTRQLAEKEQQLLELRKELEIVREREKDKDRDEDESRMKNSTDHSAMDNVNRERQLIEDELAKKKAELENLNKQLASAQERDNRRREPESNRKKHESSSEKNQERKDRDRTRRLSKENHRVDISSQNSEGSDCSTTAASLSVSRTSSSSTKNRTNHLKLRQKKNLPSRSSAPHPHPVLPPQRHHHINNKLRQEELQQPIHNDRLHSQRLREERQVLVQQMKDLLSKANTDNEKLKDELMAKENHLQYLNQELERTKTDQTELMEETYDLYKEAEKSLGKLKERLKSKETQLEQANSRLEEIRQAHEKLVAEKETVTKTADDKDVLYQNMMRDRDEEIETLKGLLESQQEEKEKLTKTADELRQEIQNQDKSQQQLSEAIAAKEEELAKVKDDVDTLTKFLQTAAAKESVARCKLEAFVSELIDRADCAEKELKSLRGMASNSNGNLTSDPSMAGGLRDHSGLIQGAVPPLHRIPATVHSNQPSKLVQGDANQILQTGFEPWFIDSSAASMPTSTTPYPAGQLPRSHPLGAASLPAEALSQPQLNTQHQVPKHRMDHIHQPGQAHLQGLPAQQTQQVPFQQVNHVPYQQMAAQQSHQMVPQSSQHLAPQQQLPSHQQFYPGHISPVPLQPTQQMVGQPLQPGQQSSPKQQISSHSQQLPSQQYVELPSQHLVPQSAQLPPHQTHAQHTKPHFSRQQTQPAFASGQSNHPQPPAQHGTPSQSPLLYANRGRRNTNPFIEEYTPQPARPHSMSELSLDFTSTQASAAATRTVVNPQHALSGHRSPSTGNSEREDSSVYAALPRRGRIDSNPFRTSAAVSRQSPAYDGGDEQVYSDSPEGHAQDDVSRDNLKVQVNSMGKILYYGSSKPTPPNPFTGKRNSSWTPTAAHNYMSNGVPDKYTKEMVNGHKNDKRRDLSSKSITPDRTYPVYWVTGNESRELPWEDLSDSNYSHQDTPHFNVGIINRRPRGKGKMKPVGIHYNNSKLSRYCDESSTDGLELSVDENGILWEAVDSFSEASESYRISPYGSETAGDVDSSVLMSSRSPSNKRAGAHVGQDTDEDIDSLDDEGILRSSGNMAGSLKKTSEKADSQLPLGERITRVLKSVGRDEDSESLEMLLKQKYGSPERSDVADTNATSVYGTERRVHRSKGESPLERALAVQDRVKSLTYPRRGKKSVTISDTSSLDLVQKPPGKHGYGNNAKPSARPRQVAHPQPVSGNKEELLKLDPLEDFSSSSYASIPPTAAPRGTAKLSNNAVDSVKMPSSTALQSPPHENSDQKSIAADPASQKAPCESAGQGNITTGAAAQNPACARSGQKTMATEAAMGAAEGSSEQKDRAANAPHDSIVKRDPASKPSTSYKNFGEENMTSSASAQNGPQERNGSEGAASLNMSPYQQEALAAVAGTSSKPDGATSHTTDQAEDKKPPLPTELREDGEPFEHKTSSVKRQPSVDNVPLTRQASVTLEDFDLQKFADTPSQPARQLRARFYKSLSQSSVQSSETESAPASPPLPLPPPVPRDKGEDDSTDFDFESDLERFGRKGRGGLRKGVVAGKPGNRKMTKQRPKKMEEKKQGHHLPAPEMWEESSSNMSDVETSIKTQRREEARRRRVALFRVFSYLDARSLTKMSLVCKEWKRVSRHPALWKNVHLKYDRISSKFLVTLSQWCTQLTSLTLEGLRCGSRKTKETMDEYHRRTRGCLEPGLEELLKTNQDTLTSLSIVACGNILTDKCMWLVSGYCRLMQRLMYVSDTHPLTAEVMWALGGGCPSITSLIIPPLFPCHTSEGLNNRCLMLIAQFYPDLLEIGVGGQSLDITGLAPLVQSCQRLTSLSLDHVKEMGNDTATALCRAGLRQLQKLELSGTSVTASALKTFYNSCRHLTELRVFICINNFFEDIRKKKNKEEYKRIVRSLEELKSQPGLGNILQLRAAPVE